MKHIVEEYNQNIYTSAIWDFYFKGINIGVLDIETTGLNPSRNKFILGGIFDCKQHQLHQILAENREEEAEALKEYLDVIEKMDVVVTYNGRHFDMPFLAKRLEVLTKAGKYHRTEDEATLRRIYDMDLFVLVQGHSPIKKLVPNLKQKTIENYMGFWDTRTDEISGAESVDLYNHYEKTADQKAEEKILLHNNDDVRQLTKLTKVISKCDMHKAMFHMGFPVDGYLIGKPMLRKGCLCIKGQQVPRDGKYIDYMGFELSGFPVKSVFSSQRRDFEMEIPVITQSSLTVIDLEAAGVFDESFQRYPNCESGFLIIADSDGIKHMEVNHFIKAFLKKFQEEAL